MAQNAELYQWWHHYFSLVVRRDVKQRLKAVGQACFVAFYAVATVFQLYHGSDMMYEIRRRKPAPMFLLTKETFNLSHHKGMAWEELHFDGAVSYAQLLKSKLVEVMAWGIKPPTFSFKNSIHYTITTLLQSTDAGVALNRKPMKIANPFIFYSWMYRCQGPLTDGKWSVFVAQWISFLTFFG